MLALSEYYQLSPLDFRSEIIAIRSERDKLALEANFAREKLEGIMKESERKVNFVTNSYHQQPLLIILSSKNFTLSLIILERRNEWRFGKKHRVPTADH